MGVRATRVVLLLVLGVLAAGALAACGAGSGGNVNDLPGSSTGDTRGRIGVVAGSNVWGDVARQIGGDRVAVTSILSDPNVDPHEYESSVTDAAAVADARLVVVNGLGYDDFVGRLLSAGHRKDLTRLTVANLVGAAKDANPHLWYDPGYVATAARAIEQALAAAEPENAATFRANLTAFLAGQQGVTDVIAKIRAEHAGAAVGYTEPVAGYLVQAAGLRLGTPAGFSKSLEDGTDPSPVDAAAFESALRHRKIAALLYNSQVTDAETERLTKLARDSGVAVVPVTETLPKGKDVQTWQAEQARALLTALGGSRG